MSLKRGKGDDRHTCGKDDMKKGERRGHKPTDPRSHQKLGDERKDPPPESSEGVEPRHQLDVRPLASRSVREEKQGESSECHRATRKDEARKLTRLCPESSLVISENRAVTANVRNVRKRWCLQNTLPHVNLGK